MKFYNPNSHEFITMTDFPLQNTEKDPSAYL